MVKNHLAKQLTKTAKMEVRQQSIIKKTHPEQRHNRVTKIYGFPTDFIWFNRMIGNPMSKLTGVVQDMAPFQVNYHDAIQDHHTVEFIKSRKLGATETWNRSCALNCFDRYSGHDVMFIAGNEVKIATEILIRFDELFRDKRHPDGNYYAFKEITPQIIDELEKYSGRTWQDRLNSYDKEHKRDRIRHDEVIRKANFGQSPTVEFKDGTRAMAYAASRQEKAQSFRGADDVIAAFVSEAAHTGMKNDQPIMTALQPNLAQRDDGDLILETTPNGRRGFAWDYWKETMRILGQYFKIPMTEHQTLVDKINLMWKRGQKIEIDVDWWPLLVTYKVGIRHNILSKKFIEKEKRNPKLDFEQEYNGKFTSTYTQAIKTEDLTFKDTSSKEYRRSIDLLGKDGINRDYGDVNYR